MEGNGIKPRNHINEQKEYIRKLEERNKRMKELKEIPIQPIRNRKYSNAPSIVKQVRKLTRINSWLR